MKGKPAYIYAFIVAALLHALLAAGLGRVIRLDGPHEDSEQPVRFIELRLVFAPARPDESLQKRLQASVQVLRPPKKAAPTEPEGELSPEPGKQEKKEEQIRADTKPSEPEQPAADAAGAGAPSTTAALPVTGQESSVQEAGTVARTRSAGRTGKPEITKPEALEPIEPLYPLGSRLRGEEGTVRLEVQVDSRGRVTQLEVIESSGYPQLDRAAEKAVQRTPFSPSPGINRPALIIAVHFRLDR